MYNPILKLRFQNIVQYIYILCITVIDIWYIYIYISIYIYRYGEKHDAHEEPESHRFCIQVREKQLPALTEKLVTKLKKAEQARPPIGTGVAALNPWQAWTFVQMLQEKLAEAASALAKVPAPPPVSEILGRTESLQ